MQNLFKNSTELPASTWHSWMEKENEEKWSGVGGWVGGWEGTLPLSPSLRPFSDVGAEPWREWLTVLWRGSRRKEGTVGLKPLNYSIQLWLLVSFLMVLSFPPTKHLPYSRDGRRLSTSLYAYTTECKSDIYYYNNKSMVLFKIK